MRVLVISDPHGETPRVRKMPFKGVDLILVAGDLGTSEIARKRFFERMERVRKGLAPKVYSARERKREFFQSHDSSVRLIEFLSKKARTLYVLGNADKGREFSEKLSAEIGEDLPALEDSLSEIGNSEHIGGRIVDEGGLRILGCDYFIDCSWAKEFAAKDARLLARAKRKTAALRKRLFSLGAAQIVLSHLPPFGTLDKIDSPGIPSEWAGKHAGSALLLEYASKFSPELFLCGHIHEAKGEAKLGKTVVHNLGFCSSRIFEF